VTHDMRVALSKTEPRWKNWWKPNRRTHPTELYLLHITKI